jgi:transcriptional regulator with XRE-family HTH domain
MKRIQPADVQIGERIRARRLELGLTLKDVAGMLGITHQQHAKTEFGKNRVPSARLYQLSKILKVPPSHFLNAEDVGDDTAGSALRTVLATRHGARLLRAFIALDKNAQAAIASLAEALEGENTP